MSETAPVLRLFYALWPTPDERALAARAAQRLTLPAAARPVAAADYHVTIAFVGATPAAALAPLRALGQAAGGARCALDFDALEYWPKPRVVVAAARSIPAEVEALWRDLHQRLAAHGFALQPKRLRPHVTLARNVNPAPPLDAPAPFRWQARTLCLVRSESGDADPAYTVLDSWPLLDEMPRG